MSFPGQAEHQAAVIAKEQPSLINISPSAPQFLKLGKKKKLPVTQALHDIQCLEKTLWKNAQHEKYFLFGFAVQGHMYNSIKILHKLQTLANCQQALHIFKSVLSLGLKSYVLPIKSS